jgi:hypothetical protein
MKFFSSLTAIFYSLWSFLPTALLDANRKDSNPQISTQNAHKDYESVAILGIGYGFVCQNPKPLAISLYVENRKNHGLRS